MVFGSFGDCTGEGILDNLQAFYLGRVDVVEEGIAVIKFGMNN